MATSCLRCGFHPATSDVYHPAEDQVLFLTEEIRRINEAITRLLGEKVELSKRLNTVQTSCRNLPDEILSDIFTAAQAIYTPSSHIGMYPSRVAIGEFPVRIIGAVCSRWRQVAWTTPALWASLDLTNADGMSLGYITQLASLYVQNAGGFPMKVMVDYNGEIFSALQWLIFEDNPQKIESLQLVHLPVDRLALLSTSFSALKRIDLSPPTNSEELSLPSSVSYSLVALPNLKEVVLEGPYASLELPWNQMTCIDISNTTFNVAARALISCPNLVHYHARQLSATLNTTISRRGTWGLNSVPSDEEDITPPLSPRAQRQSNDSNRLIVTPPPTSTRTTLSHRISGPGPTAHYSDHTVANLSRRLIRLHSEQQNQDTIPTFASPASPIAGDPPEAIQDNSVQRVPQPEEFPPLPSIAHSTTSQLGSPIHLSPTQIIEPSRLNLNPISDPPNHPHASEPSSRSSTPDQDMPSELKVKEPPVFTGDRLKFDESLFSASNEVPSNNPQVFIPAEPSGVPLSLAPKTPQSSDMPNADMHEYSMDVDNPSMDFVEQQLDPDTEYHPHPGQVLSGQGQGFMDKFWADDHSQLRSKTGNVFYPFASQEEWELSAFLLRSGLSNASIDELLKLSLIKKLSLSFATSRDLHSRNEILPSSAPWEYKPISTAVPTKSPVYLYYRNALKCLEDLLQSPLLKDHVQFTPFRLFSAADSAVRIYSEWLSGDRAWNLKDQIPEDGTLVGVILSSDKTNITNLSGGRVAHPLLMSCANINMDFRNKASNHTFQLVALLPIPHYIHHKRPIQSMLENRLFHASLDIVLEPLKVAARIGHLMSDPAGSLRWCFTPLAAYIVDTPESALIACVGGKTSSVTTATYKEFGDDFQHPPRLGNATLQEIAKIVIKVDPENLEEYWKASSEKRQNGVHLPFWRDWPLAEPSLFLTPEPLHHWHKQFWDHDVRWCLNAVGSSEIDFRFSILQPHTGLRHFGGGISSLKQVSGRDHREIQKYILPVLAGAVSPSFLSAIRGLLKFRYLAQAPLITSTMLEDINNALKLFHENKQAIIDAGGRLGTNGVIDNWFIPKLEFLQSVAPNIQANGAAHQWSADVTEHAHIEVVKKPSRASNNHGYERQICRHLDRLDKLSRFDLATAIAEAHVTLIPTLPPSSTLSDGEYPMDEPDDAKVASTSDLLALIDPIGNKPGSQTLTNPHMANYFYQATVSSNQATPNLHQTSWTEQVTDFTVLHLSCDPDIRRQPVHYFSQLFNIPDLTPAIMDFLTRFNNSGNSFNIGGRRISPIDCTLPFHDIEVWTSAKLQNRAYHAPHNILPAVTINVQPPSDDWPYGRYDSVIAAVDDHSVWPHSGLEGHIICTIKTIFRIISPTKHNLGPLPEFLNMHSGGTLYHRKIPQTPL
ncbi:hypothetical protein NP233_g10837 [Leucocoprinus birnbaumii]|uniref:DUF6830 domain-containing protein n=1 Tax=Leucocoprinus birnbaumii TaxID=56174 RepID=A0AAD5VHR1_9AGAR|nr:hypothetical protein NP233_g10837 [Leucocoprinus birnbaumii]